MPVQRGQYPRGGGADDPHRTGLLPLRMIMHSRAVVGPLLATVRAEQPDVLVYSSLFLWARVVAHALDIPGVALWPTYAPNQQFAAQVRRAVAQGLTAADREAIGEQFRWLRSTFQLPFDHPWALIRGQERLALVFLVPQFQPDLDALDDRYLFVGPCFRMDRDDTLPWTPPATTPSEHPHVYISLGTLHTDDPKFFDACLEAVAEQPWDVSMALGDRVAPARLRPAPANVTVARRLPQLRVLSTADAFVGHGGMNSTMEALAIGVPLVVRPSTAEQEMTGRRVRDLGLGVLLEREPGAPQVRAAISEVLTDSALRSRVAGLQRSLRDAGGSVAAADALQRCAAAR